MAHTRDEIVAKVRAITGKSNKDSMIEALCDSGLKQAMKRHKFKVSRTHTDVTGVLGETYFALPAACANVLSIVTLDGEEHAKPLPLKPDWWYDQHVGSPEQFASGWPEYGTKFAASIHLDRPMDRAYTFRVRYSVYPTFAAGSTTCPIATLDDFLVYFCSAYVFAAVQEMENFAVWMQQAVGRDFSNWNGGEFDAAVQEDMDSAVEISMLDAALPKSNKPTLFTEDGTTWFRK